MHDSRAANARSPLKVHSQLAVENASERPARHRRPRPTRIVSHSTPESNSPTSPSQPVKVAQEPAFDTGMLRVDERSLRCFDHIAHVHHQKHHNAATSHARLTQRVYAQPLRRRGDAENTPREWLALTAALRTTVLCAA